MKDKKIIWVTDIHLNFLDKKETEIFYEKINKENPDILLIGGDMGDSNNVKNYLEEMSCKINSKIYFVLGNHDFYFGSISETKKEIIELSKGIEKLKFLDVENPIDVTSKIGIIGQGGWADGRYGNYDSSHVKLNDYKLIEELNNLSKEERLQKLNKLGDEAAHSLENKLINAFKKYDKVFCLTHVPPFKESCWHEGKISDDNFLPHFSSKAIGDVMIKVMESNPNSYLVVLCGHTHGSGKVKILNNLEVQTGGAEYGKPKIQKVIDLSPHKHKII